MTKEEIEGAEEICAMATPGPWRVSKGFGTSVNYTSKDGTWDFTIATCKSGDRIADLDRDELNSQFIAEARTLLPRVLEELKRERKLRETTFGMLVVHKEREEKLEAWIKKLNSAKREGGT
jgi:hypothetical protein